MNDFHEMMMFEAIGYARKAADLGEIPVGSAVVCNGEIIALSHNQNRISNNPTLHAEIIAISTASEILQNERLSECDIYVTKEPCIMCIGAIVHARIKNVFIGARDYKYGACGTVIDIFSEKVLNHNPEIVFGILEKECSDLLTSFFQSIRSAKKMTKKIL